MLEIEKWAIGKPSIVAKIVQSLALKSDISLDFFESISEIASLDFFKDTSNLSDWLDLYKNHNGVTFELISIFRSFGGIAKEVAELYECLLTSQKAKKSSGQIRSISEMSKNTAFVIEQITNAAESNPELMAELEKVNRFHQDELELDLSGEVTDEQFEMVNQAIHKPAFLYLLKVLGPCFLLYMEHPTSLYRKARLGDVDSWDKLLRVDKFLISDPYISRRLTKAYVDNDYISHNRMLKALEGTPRKKSPQSSKIFYAGFISIISELLGSRLSSAEIRELFNAVAIDSGLHEQIDEDLPSSPEALTKGIQRVRNFLNLPFTSNLDN